MTTEPWSEPGLTGGKSLKPWKLAQEKQADDIERQALRFCPEFPFKPAASETFIKELSCYPDYQLVRLGPSVGDPSQPRKEVYGLYAPGDFHPIDGFGYAFEKVNKIAPLIETSETIFEYVLTRLRFELPQIFPYLNAVSQLVERKVDKSLADSLVRICGVQGVLESVRVYDKKTSDQVLLLGPGELEKALQGTSAPSQQELAVEWVLAEILNDSDRLKDFDTTQVEKLLIRPQIEVIQAVKGDSGEAQDLTDSYDVRASALMHSGEGRGDLIKVSVTLGPGGALPWNSITLESLPLTRTVDAPPPPPPLAIRTLRSRTAVQVPNWYLLDSAAPDVDGMPPTLRAKLGNRSKAWRATLAERFGLGSSKEVRNLILRAADLSFYKTFCLLEVQERLVESYRRSYALIRWHEDKFDIRPLNGTSPVLHQIHADDEKPAIDKQANDYLRFFCWAVHGEAGPFYIPHEFRELPLAVAPGPNEMQSLRQLCDATDGKFPIEDVPDDDATEMGFPDIPGVRKSAVVVYESGIFQAWFNIEQTGLIEMVKDEPIIADLTLETERYGKGDLFVLGSLSDSSPNMSADRPAAHHYLEDPKQSDDSGNTPVSETTLEEEIAQRGTVRDREVDTTIVLDDSSFPEDEISENN